jgi:hypothetical protein
MARQSARAKDGVTKMQDCATKRAPPPGPRAAATLFIGAEYRKIPVRREKVCNILSKGTREGLADYLI